MYVKVIAIERQSGMAKERGKKEKKESVRERERQTDRQTDRQADRPDRQTRQTDPTDRPDRQTQQTDRQTSRQAGRDIWWQTEERGKEM